MSLDIDLSNIWVCDGLELKPKNGAVTYNEALKIDRINLERIK